MLSSVVDAFHSFASSAELADGLRVAAVSSSRFVVTFLTQIAITKPGSEYFSTGSYATEKFG